MNSRGSIFIETLICISSLLFFIAFSIELIRMAQYHSLMQYLAFKLNRDQALRIPAVKSLRFQKQWLENALNKQESQSLLKPQHIQTECKRKGLETYLHYRYSGFFQLLNNNERFRINKKCLFRFF